MTATCSSLGSLAAYPSTTLAALVAVAAAACLSGASEGALTAHITNCHDVADLEPLELRQFGAEVTCGSNGDASLMSQWNLAAHNCTLTNDRRIQFACVDPVNGYAGNCSVHESLMDWLEASFADPRTPSR